MTSSLVFRVRRRGSMALDRIRGRETLHFLHVSKTGGTAIKQALQDAERTDTCRIVLHPHHVRLIDLPRGERVFFFLRDPVERFVSGFYSRLRKGRPRYHNPWTSLEEKAFRRFQTPRALGSAISSSDHETRWAALHAMGNIGHVRVGYRYWLGEKEYFLDRLDDVCLVGRQERLDVDFERLRDIVGLPPSVELPGDSLGTHTTPPEYDSELGTDARRNLRNWYEADYQLLELCAEHADAIGYAGPVSTTS